MKPLAITLTAVVLLALCGCAGFYMGGDVGAGSTDNHHNFTSAAAKAD